MDALILHIVIRFSYRNKWKSECKSRSERGVILHVFWMGFTKCHVLHRRTYLAVFSDGYYWMNRGLIQDECGQSV